MQQIFVLLVCVFSCGYSAHVGLLYSCNFDTATPGDNCFTTSVPIHSGALSSISDQPPTIPASDVTSIKSTGNGEVCKLPYQVGTYGWDMYFCYKSHCPTETSTNSTCASGQYAGIYLPDSTIQSFQLKTESNGINSINEQKLTFYYYISSVGQRSITVRKQEVDGTNEIIEIITSSPFNGWIEHQVTFNAMKRGYKIYFDVQKTSSESSFIDISLDEISIWGEVELTTEGPITIITSTVIDITTSIPTSTIQTTEMVTSTEESTTVTIMNTEQVETSVITGMLASTAKSIAPTTVADAETTSYSTSFDIDETTLNIKTTTVSTTTTTSAVTTKSTIADIDSTYSEATPIVTDTIYFSTQHSLENSTTTTTASIKPTLTTVSSTPTTASTSIVTSATTLGDDNGGDSPKKLIIIIISIVIPIVLIVAIGIFIKIKRSSSGGSSNKKKRGIRMDATYSESSTDNFEMNPTKDDFAF